MHGTWVGHVGSDFAEHAFLCAGGLEGKELFDLLADAVGELEADAGHFAGAAALDFEAAFEPEEFLEDEAEVGGGAEVVEDVDGGGG